MIKSPYNGFEVTTLKNTQIQIIIDALKQEQLHGYIHETFYQPIKTIKDTIARGLKSMKEPIADEDLKKIKTTFIKYEMAVDVNLAHEETILSELAAKKLDAETHNKIIEAQYKEMELAQMLLQILDQSQADCQVYDLMRQLLYKTEDRIDITHHLKKEHD